MNARVLITGGSGFIARAVIDHLRAAGTQVSGTTSSPGQANFFRLGKPIQHDLCENVTWLIHAAYDRNEPGINVEGTIALSEFARRQGVAHEIFISSVSALTGGKSDYAKAKCALENHFRALEGTTIIRPGLVVGDGGLFGRMADLVRRSPIVPLPDGGRSPVPVIGLSDLVGAIARLIQNRRTGEFNLFNGEYVTLSGLLHEYARQAKLRRLFLNVPSAPVAKLLRRLENRGLKLPITSQNFEGLNANKNAILPSHLKELLGSELSLEGLIAELKLPQVGRQS